MLSDSSDGKGKFRAALARIFNEGMSAHANNKPGNPYHPATTQRAKAWEAGWQAGIDLKAAIEKERNERR